jgi:hypothetical protein
MSLTPETTGEAASSAGTGEPGASALREYHRQLALYRSKRRPRLQYLFLGAIGGGISGWATTTTALTLTRSASYDRTAIRSNSVNNWRS